MLNTETMQLDLFQGVLLTTEQQKEVNNFIKRQAERAVSSQREVNKIMLLLDEAGFVYGQDYSSDFEVKEVTREQKFGYGYNNTNYNHEVTFTQSSGNVFLWVNRIDGSELKIYKSSVDREGDNLMCTSITSQFRYYRPSSLLTKYKEYNESIVGKLEHKSKQDVALNTIVKKYQTLYPEATVTIGSDSYRSRSNYTEFPIVRVLFKSGSSVSFQLGYGNEMDQERFHKKYDAQTETSADLLERFNNQKVK